MSADKPRLTTLRAFDAFAGGIGFILGTPRVWLHAAVPAVMMTLLLVAFTCLGGWGAVEVGHEAFGVHRGTWGGIGYWVLTVLLVIFFFLLAVLLSLVLAEPLSCFALERISQAQERTLTGHVSHSPPLLRTLWMSIRVVSFALILGGSALVILFAVNLFFPPAAIVTVPLKAVVVGWMLAWDFIDYPMTLRHQGLRARLKWVFRNFGAFTLYGLMWTFFVVVPGVVLVLLPMGVAGATRMVLLDDPRPTNDKDQDEGSRFGNPCD
jgi:uncharacterized protein involved in cysteine biosynthesis